jgi:hypothetical protein
MHTVIVFLQFYQRNFFKSALFPSLDLIPGSDIYDDAFGQCPRVCLSPLNNCSYPDVCIDHKESHFFKTFMNATNDLAETTASYTPHFNARIQEIQKLKESFKLQTSSLNSSRLLNGTEVKALFDSNYRSLLDVRSNASNFMCLVQWDTQYIAHYHAITMLHCMLILIILSLMHFLLKHFLLRRLFARYPFLASRGSSIFEALFACVFVAPLISFFFVPTPLVGNIPVHFQNLCSEVNSVSKLMADTFEPYR